MNENLVRLGAVASWATVIHDNYPEASDAIETIAEEADWLWRDQVEALEAAEIVAVTRASMVLAFGYLEDYCPCRADETALAILQGIADEGQGEAADAARAVVSMVLADEVEAFVGSLTG